jgi:hypothetical protein
MMDLNQNTKKAKQPGISSWLISSAQQAFGTLKDVLRYHEKGLVIFKDGSRWIFNYNRLYPTFYCVQRADGQTITTANQQILRVK